MEKVITCTKSELVEAMRAYNQDFLDDPEDFTEIENAKDSAILQVDVIIEYLSKAKAA